MNPLRRKSAPESEIPAEPVETSLATATKGRPTPKRRTKSAPPAPAPRTRKEASAWQKRQRQQQKANGRQNLSGAEYRKALKAGDPRVLPRREQGPVRALARDYVDSHRMLSNYMLLMFVLFLVGTQIPIFEYLTIVVFVAIFAEWFITGGKIRKLALERGLDVKEGAMTIGFYAGSRAYMPRSWRRPEARLKLGDKI